MDAWIGSMVGGVVGAVIGHLANHFISWFKENKQSSPERKFVCIELIFLLEDYATKCADVAQDEGEPVGVEGEYESVIRYPEPIDYSSVKGNWKALNSKIMYEVCSLPVLQKNAIQKINFIGSDSSTPPRHTKYFDARRYWFSVLGLKAAEIADKIREENGFPKSDLGEWIQPTLESCVSRWKGKMG